MKLAARHWDYIASNISTIGRRRTLAERLLFACSADDEANITIILRKCIEERKSNENIRAVRVMGLCVNRERERADGRTAEWMFKLIEL